MATRQLVGYAKAVRVYAIIECVCYCITIVGLIFIYFPIIGMNIVNKWDVGDARCVRLILLWSL